MIFNFNYKFKIVRFRAELKSCFFIFVLFESEKNVKKHKFKVIERNLVEEKLKTKRRKVGFKNEFFKTVSFSNTNSNEFCFG
jgi:hypothetical protein